MCSERLEACLDLLSEQKRHSLSTEIERESQDLIGEIRCVGSYLWIVNILVAKMTT